ncbi:MAG: hypothetical protein M3443_19600, partial [Actinomycetota bacterium]|nr:hypothetical protein [Actinomycetota bacterium]
MSIDDRTMKELIDESQDLHVDAMRDIKETLPELAEIREERRSQPVDVDEIDRFNAGRRQVLKGMGFGAGGLAARGLV